VEGGKEVMKKRYLLFCILLVSLLLSSIEVFGAAPPKKREIVYSLNVWDGKDYAAPFYPASSDTIYVMADFENVYSVKETLVYYWPITREYMADWDGLNKDVGETLEVLKGDKVIGEYKKVDYVFYYPKGYWGGGTQLFTGEKARAKKKEYDKAMDKYWKEVDKYYKDYAEYNKKLEEFYKKIQEGKPAGAIPKEPKQPRAPTFYVTDVSKAYVFSLPVGRYTIRAKDKDGKIIPGTVKTLIAFSHRREGIGYDIIPESKWTYPETANDSSDIIYQYREGTLYFQPYKEWEFNELEYNKLSKPQSAGRPDRWIWVHMERAEKIKLNIFSKNNLISQIRERPYYVEQIPGSALGYNIKLLDRKEYPYATADFTAFKFSVPPTGDYKLVAVDKNGGIIENSDRYIRPITVTDARSIFIASFGPIVIGLIIYIIRRVGR